MLLTWNPGVRVTPVLAQFSLSPLFNLNALAAPPLSNEEMFHCILQRGCKAVGAGGPDSVSLRLFQTLVSHYYSGKPERVKIEIDLPTDLEQYWDY